MPAMIIGFVGSLEEQHLFERRASQYSETGMVAFHNLRVYSSTFLDRLITLWNINNVSVILTLREQHYDT